MEFLASFRLGGRRVEVKQPRLYVKEDIYEEGDLFTKFLFLPITSATWKFVQFFGVIGRFMITTYTIVFFEGDEMSALDYVNVAFDVLFFADLLSAFIYRWHWPNSGTPPESLTSEVARLVWRNNTYEPRKIWMITLDIISLIPFEIVRIWVPYHSFIHVIAHCIPLLRSYRFFAFHVDNVKNILLRSTIIVELNVKFAILWVLVSHIFVVVYYWYLQETDSDSLRRAPVAISFDVRNPFSWYLVFFYVNQFAQGNIGFGDIPPTSDGERIITTSMCLVGFGLLNGYLISALSNAITEKIRRIATMRFRISLMRNELGKRRVPQEVTNKFENFYHNLWVSRKGIGANISFDVPLPPSLFTDVFFDIFRHALNASLLFRYIDEGCKRAISRVMEINLYMAGDTILRRSEISSQMLYIRKGTVEIMSYQDDETQIVTYGAGSLFGQVALLMSLPARSEVHAATFCEIHILNRKNLFGVLNDYPKAKELIFDTLKNILLNVMADKFKNPDGYRTPENVLSTSEFYKVPIQASRISRNDICVVNTCPYIFEPNTVYLEIWGIMVAFLVLIILFYYPYCATFDRFYPKQAEPFLIIADFILFVDVYLTFSTAFTKENILFSSLREIVVYQLRKFTTYVDVIALFPIHYFISDNNRVKPVVLCLRCLKIYKIYILFDKAETSVAMKMIAWLRLIKYILYFFFIDYIVGIIYYLEACFNDPCASNSWYPNNAASRNSGSPIWSSMYIAILITSGTGFGDITPKNMRDVVCVIMFCLVGVFLFIYLISEFSASLSLDAEPKQNFMNLAERVTGFLMKNKMLLSEKIRVRQFLNLQWERDKGYEFSNSSNLFYDTPKHLLYEISQFTKSKNFHRIKLFKEVSDDILRLIMAQSYRRVLPPHEVVIYAGEVCSSMIMIEEGFCEVPYLSLAYGKDVTQRKIIGAGHDLCTVELMLGEVSQSSLDAQHVPSTVGHMKPTMNFLYNNLAFWSLTSLCNARTLTHCTLLKVRKHHLLGCLKSNHIAYTELEKSIEEFKTSAVLKEVLKIKPTRLHLIVRPSIQKSFYRFKIIRKQGGSLELKLPYLKLGLCQWIRFILWRATLLPYGKALKVWEVFRCVFAFLSAMLLPMLPYFQLQIPELFYVGFALDLSAWIDIYVRIHVCYYNSINVLVTHPFYTFCHYLKGGFILDFVGCFPFDRIMSQRLYDSRGYAFVTSTPINIFRCFRVVQIYRIPATVNNLGADFLSNPGLFRMLIMMVALTIIFLHVMTSLLILHCMNYKVNKNNDYFVVIPEQFQEHFTKLERKYNLTTEPLTMYFVNFYWVTETAVSLGYGDITATCKELMIFIIILIILSYLTLNYVTILVASYLSSVNLNLTLYQKWMSHLIQFLKNENVEPLLRKHIVNHFEYVWEKQKGMKARTVIRNFNQALKNDVLLYLYEETLKNVGAFYDSEQTLFRVLSSHLDEMNYRSGAGIYKTGDILSEVYIVHQGEVTVVGKDEEETFILGPSMIFGHLDMTKRAITQLSAVATKNVTILSINTSELYYIVAKAQRWSDAERETEMEKLRDALMTSNEHVLSQDVSKKSQSTPRSLFYYWTYKMSKYIMIFYVVLSFFSMNEVTYNAAFQGYSVAFAFILVPIEILFMFKIFLGFTTGYMNEAGDVVADHRLIRRRYMRSNTFYLDIFTVIPFEVLAFAFAPRDQGYAASLFRLTKVLRGLNIRAFFNMKIDTLNVNMVLVKMADVAVWTTTLLHQCTCIWFFISCHRSYCPDSESWNVILNGKFDSLYVNSLYFIVVVLTTTGFGDVSPYSSLEFLCVDIYCFVGFFYTAIFIGQIISTVQKSFLDKSTYQYAVTELKTLLEVNEVRSETKAAALRYAGYSWRNEKGQQIPVLLKNAPPYLINEIKQSTYGHHINNNPVFSTCNPFFRNSLINKLRRTVFYPGDVIANEGEVTRTIHFVHIGLVETSDSAEKYVKKVYGKNTFFGFRQGVLEREPFLMTYTAKTLCNILSLLLKEWEHLSEFYPDDVKHIEAQAKHGKWP